MSAKTWVLVAAILGAVAVMLGAFGAHAFPGWLRSRGLEEAILVRRLENLEIGVRYQMYHALALMAVGCLQLQAPARMISVAGWLWIVGILLFSGCLYLYALSGLRLFAMIVPLGGVSFIAGWLALAYGVASSR